jgi:hypothetical protein
MMVLVFMVPFFRFVADSFTTGADDISSLRTVCREPRDLDLLRG